MSLECESVQVIAIVQKNFCMDELEDKIRYGKRTVPEGVYEAVCGRRVTNASKGIPLHAMFRVLYNER